MNTKEKDYCERDPGCRPACHTRECIRESILKSRVENPNHVGPFERIRLLESELTQAKALLAKDIQEKIQLRKLAEWQDRMLERAKHVIEMVETVDEPIEDFLADLEAGPVESARKT
jgi:hypothetical protein